MSTRRKQVVSLLIVGLATAGLVWLLSEIGWSRIAWHLAAVGIQGFLFLTAAALCEAVMDALALKYATLGQVGFWRVLYVNQVGSILNSLAPGEAGEVLKASMLSKDSSGHGFPGAIVWNLAFRLTKAVMIILAAAIAVMAVPTHRMTALLMFGLGCVGVLVFVALDTIIRRQWVGRLLTFFSRWRFLNRERIKSFIDKARSIEEQAGNFRKHHSRHYSAVLIFQCIARIGDVVLVVWMLQLLGSGFDMAFCLLVYAGVQLVSYLLPLFPTRVGTAEGSSYLLFVFLGIGGGLGAIFQVLLRIIKLMASATCILVASMVTLFTSERRLASTSACIPSSTPSTPVDTERSIQTAHIQRL